MLDHLMFYLPFLIKLNYGGITKLVPRNRTIWTHNHVYQALQSRTQVQIGQLPIVFKLCLHIWLGQLPPVPREQSFDIVIHVNYNA